MILLVLRLTRMSPAYSATSKQCAKSEGREKLRGQLEAAGASVKYTFKEVSDCGRASASFLMCSPQGFVVEMTRVQRSYFMRNHPDTHLGTPL